MPKVKHRKSLGLSAYFKNLKEGDRVAIVINASTPFSLPKRIIGLTGTVKGRRGKSYIIEAREGGKTKHFILPPVHLKKIKSID